MSEIIKRKENKKFSDSKEEVLLGVDYGEKNIGVAFGRAGLVMPLRIVEGRDEPTAIKEIGELALENKVNKIIMGLPLTADDKETMQSKKTRRFAKLIKIYLKMPVEFFNEYGSSDEALGYVLDTGFSQKSRERIDHISAAIILKKYYRSLEDKD